MDDDTRPGIVSPTPPPTAALAADSFEEGLVVALKTEADMIRPALDVDTLPDRTLRYVRRGAWALIEAGAESERRRIDARFAELLDDIREDRRKHTAIIATLTARIDGLEAEVQRYRALGIVP
jgi:hypothetical protein